MQRVLKRGLREAPSQRLRGQAPPRTMHLYKPACADIPPHKPSLQKPSEALLKGKKPSVVPKICPPLCGWAGKASGAAELKQLEKFLHVHGLSLQDTVRAETGMKYRYQGCRGAAWGGSAKPAGRSPWWVSGCVPEPVCTAGQAAETQRCRLLEGLLSAS